MVFFLIIGILVLFFPLVILTRGLISPLMWFSLFITLTFVFSISSGVISSLSNDTSVNTSLLNDTIINPANSIMSAFMILGKFVVFIFGLIAGTYLITKLVKNRNLFVGDEGIFTILIKVMGGKFKW
jgi:hypothetical protein